MGMKPLEHSWAADQLEDELRRLGIALYMQTLAEKSDEINVYGAPHIGPFSLIEREVAKDGLAVLRNTDEDAIRHLYRAWRFRNPRRGTHFLRTYLQVLFGNNHEINQLWQAKALPYPDGLRTDGEVQAAGLQSSHYLTSRVRVDIDTDYLSSLLKNVLRTTVPARIVLDVRTAKYGGQELGLVGLGMSANILNGSNVDLPPYIPPDPEKPNDDYGTVKRMLADLWEFIQRATGARAAQENMPPMVTAEGIVKDRQFSGSSRNEYTADSAATSESYALLLRGVAHAYRADGDISKLGYAKFLMDSMCKYLFANRRPPANNNAPWYHNWLLNAGERFNVRGPLAANGALDEGGRIGVNVAFTNGIGLLTPAPDIVYQVTTGGAQFEWPGVVADIVDGTGQRVEVDYYIDRHGSKIIGTQSAGAFGQPITKNSGEPAGRIVLKTPANATYKVNYCTTVGDVFVEFGEAYEAYPMWRKLATAERSMIAGAVHWFIDAFRHLRAAEPGNPEWALAHNRMLDVWKESCQRDSNSTNIFVTGQGEYNNFPLTYSYAYGLNNVDNPNSKWENVAPGTYYTAERDETGFVLFSMPADDSAPGSGGKVRKGVAFVNDPVYLEFNQSSLFYIDTQSSTAMALTAEITTQAGVVYTASVLASPTSEAVAIAMADFLRFGSIASPAPSIRPGFTVDRIGQATAGMLEYGETTNDKAVLVSRFTIQNRDSAIALSPQDYGLTTANAPVVGYFSTSDMLIIVTDAQGWRWSALLPRQAKVAEQSLPWSEYSFAVEQDPANVGKPQPSAPSGNLRLIQFQGSPNAHGANGTTPQAISIAYIAGVIAVSATSGDIRRVRLINTNPAAHTWRVGSTTLNSGSRRAVRFYGSLPYALTVGGPGRAHLAKIPFRGPYVAGYQSGTPWVDLSKATELGQMLDLMLESQNQFSARSPAALSGPFMGSYLPAVWDSEKYGEVDSWVWEGPDGNPAWSGWQFRAFDAMASTWNKAVEKKMSVDIQTKAKTICTRFLTWLHEWLQQHKQASYLPKEWRQPGLEDGAPMPAGGYLDPRGAIADAHDLALALKGALYCALAGADRDMCKYVIERCVHALPLAQVHSEIDPMRGSFTNDPAEYKAFSIYQGEVLDALALAWKNQDLLPEDARDVDENSTLPNNARVTTDGGVRVVIGGEIRITR